MSTPRIIAIGASAGSLETLLKMSRELPATLPAPVCIVLHMPPLRSSVLPDLLNRARRLPAEYANGQRIAPGRIYVAPPDAHLLIEDGCAVLGRGPRENGSRPAADPLFRSVAQAYGPGAIGVVLSGALQDGTAGLAAIKAMGGTTVVQDPEEALHSSMPKSALDHVAVDHVVGAAELPRLLERLLAKPFSKDPHAVPPNRREALAHEIEIARSGVEEHPALEDQGEPSPYACPDCHGVLWEIKDGDVIRFRCRVGHAYLPDGLREAQSRELEEALWTALRSLRESGALAARLAANARQRGLVLIAEAHEGRAQEANARAQVIEEVLRKGQLGAALPSVPAGGTD